MKLAFVVQRYGADIAGGSEMHCRQLAERFSSRHDITVITTCARDYVTWENAYPPGTSMENSARKKVNVAFFTTAARLPWRWIS